MKDTKQKTRKSTKSFLVDSVKGVTLGISAAIPGLSAGTIAVAESCYDTLIDAITSLRKAFKKNFLILLPYILGMLVGALAALVGIGKGYDAAPFSLTGLFAGFVFGSLPVTFKELKHGKNGKEVTIHILNLILCFLIAGGLGVGAALAKLDLATSLQDRVWWMYLLIPVAGFIAAAACIIPGISGSMTLMVIGIYYPINYTFFHFHEESSHGLSIWISSDGAYIGTGVVLFILLALGALAGVIVSSKVMKVLLKKHRVSTFYGILGLILGSLISMFINSDIYPLYPTIQTWDYIVGAVLFVIAAVLVYLLIRYTDKKNAKQAAEAEAVPATEGAAPAVETVAETTTTTPTIEETVPEENTDPTAKPEETNAVDDTKN